MNDEAQPERSLTLEELSNLRRTSEAVSIYLHEQIEGYLETLRPLLSPARVFGKHAGGRDEIAGEGKALAGLKEDYQAVCGPPFRLPRELDVDWLADVGDRIELCPWAYTHEARSPAESRPITITSPVRWIISYRASGYTLSHFAEVMAGHGQRRGEHVRQCVVNALVMKRVMFRQDGLTKLFEGLRYTVVEQRLPGMGELPVLTLTSCLEAFRPSDELMLAATGFSGVPAFIELIDMEALHRLPDPLKAAIENMSGH